MAINFPATGGQATDGSFTYTVAGIVYAWTGSCLLYTSDAADD